MSIRIPEIGSCLQAWKKCAILVQGRQYISISYNILYSLDVLYIPIHLSPNKKKINSQPVYKGHSGEHENVPLMSSCSLYTG